MVDDLAVVLQQISSSGAAREATWVHSVLLDMLLSSKMTSLQKASCVEVEVTPTLSLEVTMAAPNKTKTKLTGILFY